MPQQAREGSVKTWVRLALPSDAVGRQRGAIRADQHRRRTDDGLDVGLIHAGDEDTGVAMIGDEVVAHRLQGIATALTRYVTHGTPGVLWLVWRDGDTDGVPGWNPAKIVQPVRLDVVPQASPHCRVCQALEHSGHAILLHPGRQQVPEGIRCYRVGILIAIEAHAALTCRFDCRQKLRGSAPIITAGEFEMSDLHVDIAGLTYGDGFLHGGKDAVRFIPDMGGVVRAIAMQHLP